MAAQTQLLVKIDPEVKKKVARIARQEGKTTSLVVREMIETYIEERDITATIDDLWARIGRKMKVRGRKPEDVRRAVRASRAAKA